MQAHDEDMGPSGLVSSFSFEQPTHIGTPARMHKAIRYALIVVLAVLMAATFYMIFFGAGNPNSIVRRFIEDTSYDLLITIGLGVLVGLIVLVLTSQTSSHPLEYMLEQNRKHVDELRAQGKNDEYIARDFLKSVGIKNRFIYWLALRRVRRTLRRMK
jgi:sensor histidine kinase YesM